MSFQRVFILFYKDITLFFKGRRKIRRKAEILYFMVLFVVAFFMAILYRNVKIQTGMFATIFTFFLYLLMSFIFELKHFIFCEEDIKIIKRLPVIEKEYYISKGLMVISFGIIFTLTAYLGHSIGAYVWAKTNILSPRFFIAMMLGSFFSISFSMFVYAILLRIFRTSNSSDVVSKVQIALGIFFGLIFAFSPNLAPLLDAIDSGIVNSKLWFKLLPFTFFVDILRAFTAKVFLISLLYIIAPLLIAIVLGFNESEIKREERVKDVERFLLIRNRKKRGIFSLVLTHLLRSKLTKRTLIAPSIINMIVLILWSFNKDAQSIIFFGVWTLVFMSVILSLALSISDSYKASWMLKKAPMLNGDVIATGLNAGYIYIVVPYGIFVYLIFILKGISFRIAILPIAYGLVMSYFFLQVLFITKPSMPFSRAGFERGVNSLKEILVSFVLVPGAAASFNLVYKMKNFCLLKIIIIAFFLAGYSTNHFISRKSFKLEY